MKIEKISQDEGVITVTEEEYYEQLSRGLTEEEVLKPGWHQFIRGGFLKRNPGFDPSKIEVRYTLTLSLNPDVYNYFAAKADEEGVESCAEVIQNLMTAMAEKDIGKRGAVEGPAQNALLKNPKFIQAVADQVKKKLAKKSASIKSSSTTKSRRRAA